MKAPIFYPYCHELKIFHIVTRKQAKIDLKTHIHLVHVNTKLQITDNVVWKWNGNSFEREVRNDS